MRLKSKIKLLFVFTMVSLIGFGCKYEKKEDIEPTVKEPRIYKYDDELLASGKAIEGDNCYVIGGKPQGITPGIIPSIYAVETHYQLQFETLGKRDDGYFIFRTETEELYFDVYSIESGKKLKTNDVKTILQEECPELQVAATYFHEDVYQGKPCMRFAIGKHPDSFEDGLEDIHQEAYLNVDSEELFIVERSEQRMRLSILIQETEIFNDSNYSLFGINGIEDVKVLLTAWEGCCMISMPITSLSEENKLLYTLFPNLKEELEEIKQRGWNSEKEVPYICICLTDYPTSEDIISLFLPDVQEISFAGMKISKKSSVDGEEHDIHSFEEYQQFMEPYELIDESELHPIFKNE